MTLVSGGGEKIRILKNTRQNKIPTVTGKGRIGSTSLVVAAFVMFDCLSDLEPSASFECVSGVLAWGQLDCVLGAKRKLLNNKLKFDAIRTNGSSSIGHRYRCQALKGKWNKYDHDMVWLTAGQSEEEDAFVKRGRNVFLCHESYSPLEIAEKGSTVDFSWSIPPDMSAEVIYVNRFEWGESHEPRLLTWKGRASDVFLVDPAWDVAVPEKNRDLRDQQTTEQLLQALNAGFTCQCATTQCCPTGTDSCRAVQLLDAAHKCCGLLCRDFDHCWDIYARLVFNEKRQLIGMCVFDDLGRKLYQGPDCHGVSSCSDNTSTDSSCDETSRLTVTPRPLTSTSCHSYSDMTYSFEHTLDLTEPPCFEGSVTCIDSDDSYDDLLIEKEDDLKTYDYFEDFVDWLTVACMDMTIDAN